MNQPPGPLTRERRGAVPLFKEIGSTLAAYVWGQIVISLILTVVYAIGFALLRVPLWFLLAPLCGMLNLVPRFGAIFAMILALGVGALGGLSLERLAGVLGVLVVAFTLEGYWLTPRILGRRLQLRPLYVFLAVLIGGAMFGFIGLLLAVPVLAIAGVIWRYFTPPRPPAQ